LEFWLRIIIALFIGAHGLVYLIAPFTPMAPSISKGWKGSSAMLGTALSKDSLESLTTALWVIAGIGLLATAATIAMVSFVPGLWRPIAVSASLLGVASFAVFYDGQTPLFVNQGGVGVIIDLAVVTVALGIPQAIS
jgi:hypothetical protein